MSLLARDDRRRDAPEQVRSADRETFEGEVAGLGAVDAREEVDRVGGGATLASEAERGDGRVAIAVRQLIGDLEALAPVAVDEEIVDAAETGTRERALDAHVAVTGGALQVRPELELELRIRREITMPPLGRRGDVLLAVPHEHGFPEPGARGDDRDVGPLLALPLGDDDPFGRTDERAAHGACREIVDEPDLANADLLGELALVDHFPGQVGDVGHAADDGTRDGEHGGDDAPFARRQVLAQKGRERARLGARQHGLVEDPPGRSIVEAEARVGSADVPREDHFFHGRLGHGAADYLIRRAVGGGLPGCAGRRFR